MDGDAPGVGWRGQEGTAEDLVLLESHVRESLHELNLKRRSLVEARDQLDSTDLARHELERLLERSRQQCEETQLQLDLAATAARRWEDVGVAGREAASRQRSQLEQALGERDGFRDQARQLQTEVARLRSKTERDEGQLRLQASSNESHSRGLANVRTLQDTANRQLQKLEGDNRRLEAMVAEALSQGAELGVLVKHRASMGERTDKQRDALEGKVAQLAVELQRMKVSSPSQSKLLVAAGEEETTRLKELVREMEAQLMSKTETNALLMSANDQALRQQTRFHQQLAATQEKLAAEQVRAAELEANLSALGVDVSALREKLRSTQQILQTERESSKKAECVERGVQCSLETDQLPLPPPPDNPARNSETHIPCVLPADN